MRHRKTKSRQYVITWQRILLLCCLWLCACAVQAATYSSAATTLSWVDPSAHTNVTWTSGASCTSGYANAPVDDDITAQLPLGFTFNFGGVNYTTVQIMSNGRLQFGNGYCGFGTQAVGPPRTYPLAFPNASLLRTLKVYAADLDSGAGGTVRYAALGSSPNRSFVVTWTNVPEWNSPTWSCAQSCFNLQVILNENGDFVYQYGSSANASNGKAQIGWELTATDYSLYTFANIGALANTAVRFYIPAILAEYRLDESAWGGASSVINTASASFYGTPFGAIASTASGYICRGADIPLNTDKNTIDAIDTGINVSSDLGALGAVSFWYKGRTAWNDGNDRMLLDATSNNSAPFFLSKRADGRLRFVLQDSANNIFVNETGTHNFAANTWHHIAITWSLGASGRMIVYIDGNIDRQLNISATNALDNRGGTLFIGDNQSKAVSNNPTNNSANGYIDEARFYNYEISSAIVNRDRLAGHSCSVLNNFLITIGAASASTCTPKSIQITARDAANATLTGYTGSISLSTSSAHGDWSIVTASGALTNGTADDGAASYGFVAADNGSITLALSDSHADDLTVSVSDAGAGVTSISSTLNFRDNVFVITEDAIQVAGRDQAMNAALWTKDAITGNCAVNAAYGGVMPFKAWLTRDIDDPNGVAPSINAVALPNAQPGASNLSMTFSSGTAVFNLASSDVGKYALNLLDDTRVFADGVDIAGASNTLTTRPFGLGFTAIQQGATANPGGANPADAVFVAAGATFEATVGAYRWQAADDANNDGVPDSGADITNNGLTPAFAWPVSLTAALNTPAAGTPGALGGTTAVAQASFSGGAATVNDLTYSEVGSMNLLASASNYLNTASADYTDHSSGVVGRFVPDHFAVSGLMNGSLANACGAFTYTGQMNGAAGAIAYLVKPQFTIAAQNAANGTAANYTGLFAKLISSGVTLTALTEDGTQLGMDAANKVRLDANLFAGTLTDSGDGTFDYVLGDDDFAYLHEDNSRVGPFTSDIPLTIATIAEPIAADGVTTTIVGQELAPAGVEIRLGRLALQNAYGSELLALPINLTAEYYADLDGAGPSTDLGFVTNTDDTCTGVASANVTLTANSPLVAGDSNLTVAANPFINGSWHTTASGPYSQLSAPASGNQGSVDLVVDLDAASLGWLKYDWDGVDQGGDLNKLDDNPTARAVFGIYQGPGRRIYMRERFN